MSESAAGIPVYKPQNIWKRQVKVNLRSLFSTLGKAALNGAFLQWDDLAEFKSDSGGISGFINKSIANESDERIT